MLMALGLVVFASCSDDRDDNPTIVSPTTFHVNTPALADQYLDLAKSDIIELTCSQPDYGFPANTQYTVQVSLDENMANYKEVEQTFKGAKLEVNAALLASTLTTCAVEQGKTEADFPMDIPVYLRVRAVMTTVNGTPIEGTEIVSQNIVKLSRVHLLFSLPPVNIPSNLYLVGDFCGWDWGKSLSMVPVYGTDNMFWHMVYISDQGIKFNQERSWDGGEIGYAGITVAGDLASEIVDGGGNIASSKPGWYLMVVTFRDATSLTRYSSTSLRYGSWDHVSATPTGASCIRVLCSLFLRLPTVISYLRHSSVFLLPTRVYAHTLRFLATTGGILSSWYSTRNSSIVAQAATRSVFQVLSVRSSTSISEPKQALLNK